MINRAGAIRRDSRSAARASSRGRRARGFYLEVHSDSPIRWEGACATRPQRGEFESVPSTRMLGTETRSDLLCGPAGSDPRPGSFPHGGAAARRRRYRHHDWRRHRSRHHIRMGVDRGRLPRGRSSACRP